jgi:hypothetical protein
MEEDVEQDPFASDANLKEQGRESRSPSQARANKSSAISCGFFWFGRFVLDSPPSSSSSTSFAAAVICGTTENNKVFSNWDVKMRFAADSGSNFKLEDLLSAPPSPSRASVGRLETIYAFDRRLGHAANCFLTNSPALRLTEQKRKKHLVIAGLPHGLRLD